MRDFSTANPLFATQFRRPFGASGRIAGWIMLWQNRALNRIAVSNLEVGHDDTVLEIGFGSGAAIKLLTQYSDARHICGIDPSDVMMEEATARNEDAIAVGRVHLLRGTVLKLPFRNKEFSRVFAVSTFHDWKDRATGLREIRKVLRDNGRLLLCLRPASRVRLPWSLPGLTEANWQKTGN